MNKILILVIALLAAPKSVIALPTSVNAEKKEDPAWNRVTANFYLMGGLMTTCFAHKEGYISDMEKEDLMRFNIGMHRELHEVGEFYVSDQVDKFKKVRKAFPDCYRELK